jgi:hypothetical protein
LHFKVSMGILWVQGVLVPFIVFLCLHMEHVVSKALIGITFSIYV